MNARSIITCLLSLVLACQLHGEDKQETLAARFPLLAKLKPPTEVPAICSVKEVPTNIPALQGFENQSITLNPQLFVLTDPRLSEVIEVKSIQAAYLSLYGDTEESGVVGWAFTNAELARKAHREVVAHYGNQKRIRIWLVDNHVVWLWRDRSRTNPCYEYLEEFLNSRLKNATVAP